MARKLWKEVFEEEKAVIRKWRESREKLSGEENSTSVKKTAETANHGGENLINSAAKAEGEFNDLVGLAFSGGGIRSATFGLGVLEALKEKGLLTQIDYLSTVSGGGYIGSWLSSNCRHTEERRKVQTDKEPSWLEPKADWTASIRHLRRYSNYLSPTMGFFSADSWSLVTIWLRNTILIQLMVISALASLLLLPRILQIQFNDGFGAIENILVSILFILITVFIVLNLIKLNEYKGNTLISRLPDYRSGQFCILGLVVSFLIGGFCFSESLWNMALKKAIVSGSYTDSLVFICNQYNQFLTLCFLSFTLFTIFSVIQKSQDFFKKFYLLLLAPLVSTAVMVLLFAGILLILSKWTGPSFEINKGQWMAFVWAPTFVIASISFSINILIGMLGKETNEYIREWWSRFAAWLAIIGFSWMVIVVVAVYGPLWTFWFYYEGPWKTLGSGWLLSTLAGLIAGKSADTGLATQQNTTIKIKEIIAKLAPFVFIAGLLVAVSTVLHLVIAFNPEKPETKFHFSRDMVLVDDSKHLTDDLSYIIDKQIWDLINRKTPDADVNFSLSMYKPEKKDFVYSSHWKLLSNANNTAILFVCAVSLFCVLLLGKRVDINEFSLNAFYRNRLARCYLGAARKPKERDPHPFIGFDPKDDFNLSDLLLKSGQEKEPFGPFHIINCALNLGGSSDLGVHTRHSNSFALTPLYCGSSYVLKNLNGTEISPIGYIDTEHYGGDKRPMLGQAVSVSGAAASPNMGYHTSAPVAFLMTLFNARLGWWFPNPYNSKCDASSPPFSLEYLFYELFGMADEKCEYLNISDGGHFENLAAYELVKRRCKVVIISDGECDPKMQFEGLSNLIRLCEVDRLAKIEIDVSAVKSDDKSGWSTGCCAIGKIKYSAFPTAIKDVTDGWLIYIKAAMTGHEDTAIMQYKATHPDFPHETTGDQFYSEDQFESYRTLGKSIAIDLFSKWNDDSKLTRPMENIANDLSKILSPELVHQTLSIFHADRLIDIWRQLSENENIKDFNMKINRADKDITQPMFYFCNEIIQLMENVYLDLNMEETWEREDNSGWMELFKYWANSPQVIKVWEKSKITYGIKFQSFWERKLKIQPINP